MSGKTVLTDDGCRSRCRAIGTARSNRSLAKHWRRFTGLDTAAGADGAAEPLAIFEASHGGSAFRRGHFRSDDAALMLIWLALRHIMADWRRPAENGRPPGR